LETVVRSTDLRAGEAEGATAESLAFRAAAGSHAAFEALVRMYERRVYGLAYRYVHDRHEAQDLVQEIFLRLFSRLGRFDPRRRFDPWFWRLAAHVCLNYVRRRVTRPLVLNPLDDGQLEGPALAEESDVGAALVRLRPPDRLLLLLHYRAGIPLDECARVLGVRLPAVRSRLYRAREELRRALTSSAA
jgi:RNA polymerase sigma-70 factor (ECF subfamily)